jgi:hypothetical protein
VEDDEELSPDIYCNMSSRAVSSRIINYVFKYLGDRPAFKGVVDNGINYREYRAF